jgi:hypothetical protein
MGGMYIFLRIYQTKMQTAKLIIEVWLQKQLCII